MYRYDDIDRQFLKDRVKQFRGQMDRYLNGQLAGEEFLPLRLQNGLYVQRHAPMLRIAVPYGQLRSDQLRMLAHVTRTYDKGFGHFSTRHNLQLNWPPLERVPDILADLASVDMHAIQTSGNCVRNVTTDHFAGVAPDELTDPRPWCEIIRQWSTFHPEFAYLPRKFKIGVNAAGTDRVGTAFNDIGLHILKNAKGELGFRVMVGGGLGRNPYLGETIRDFLPWPHLLSYLDAILRVYNRHGRRDNRWKARIKFLVASLGREAFAQQVEEEWQADKASAMTLTQEEVDRISAHFTAPPYAVLDNLDPYTLADDKPFHRWLARNVHAHRQPGYAAVTLSLKKSGIAPGNISDSQLDTVADLADAYSFGEIRVSHEQNLVLPDVPQSALLEVWQKARAAGFATPTVGLLTDLICCPGGDLCSLANARSVPVAQAILDRFDDLDYLFDLGDLDLNISGCMNACSHHHLGHIGVLGVDKGGEEWYQITLGGRKGNDTRLGKVIGRSLPQNKVADAVEAIIRVFVEQRHDGERFLDTLDRVGVTPFKERVYANH